MANLSSAAQRQLTILLQLLSVQDQKAVAAALDYVAGALPEASLTVEGTVKQGAAVANITPAVDGTTAGTALNALLASLRTAGVIAP